MKKKIARRFIPSDIQRIVTRIHRTWTKLADQDIAYYLEGERGKFIKVLQAKYNFNHEQAETVLSSIERLV